ncbi:MAG: 3-deoxy-D-manno-octulosonic acid transferase [Lentimicrobium sp.]|nr:3-deoxy-D-manno-octulosonic acid transferase [Lentimicrobium sp.]
MRFLYSTGVVFYYFILRIAALFSIKARDWHYGRKDLFVKLEEVFAAHHSGKHPAPVAWFHCASLGEFEQGKPVIEAYRQEFPGHLILLTFFSPSGYNHRSQYNFVDHVFYLPIDSMYNARKFVGIVKPTVAIFVKYEFWFNYLDQLFKHQVPVFTISAIFRPDQHFFRWYGGWFRTHLRKIQMIFVQDEESAELLNLVDVRNVTVSGDTRFDRVVTSRAFQQPFPLIERFAAGKHVLVAGSTWPQDEDLILDFYRTTAGKVNLIIAPHEISDARVEGLLVKYGNNAIRYSQAPGTDLTKKEVLIIDSIGMLSQLYRYASIAYIGGGFGVGIHNTLEAAASGIPVFFGPNYQRFREAREMVAIEAAFPVNTPADFTNKASELLMKQELHDAISAKAAEYVSQRTGATQRVMEILAPAIRAAEKNQ